MAPIWNALYEDYADIVLAGHEHSYERLAPADAAGAAGPAGESGPGSWARAAGAWATSARRRTRPTDVRDNTTYGVLKLTLHGPAAGHPRGWYEWQFVDDGQSGLTPFTDSGSGDCVVPRPALTHAGGHARH